MKSTSANIYGLLESASKSIQIFYCGYQRCGSGHSFGPAVRGQYLMHFIVSGKGSYRAQGKTCHLGAGQAFLIKPGESTYYQADETDPWEYMWVAFDGVDAPELVEKLELQGGYTGTAADPEEMRKDLEYINENLSASTGDLAVLGRFYCAMAQLEKKRPTEDFDDSYISKATEYIHNNFIYPISIQEVADYIGIDRSYLYRLFMAKKGISPKKYLLSVRLNMAKTMLLQNRYSIAEIALSCGFSDPASFCNQFKKATGMTPRQSVKNHSVLSSDTSSTSG